MKVLTLPDGQDSIAVWPANGTSAVVLQSADVSGGSSGVVLTGGDIQGASFPVGDGASVDVQTLNIDTTGLGIGGALIQCAGSVGVVGNGELFFEVILDGEELSPALGCLLNVADGTVAAYSIGGVLSLSEGAHTIVVRCTTFSGTTCTVNPSRGEAGPLSISTLLWFTPA